MFLGVPLPEKPTLEFSSFNEEREGVHARRRFNQTKQIEETKFGEDNKNETIHRREHHEGIDEEEIEVYRSHTNQTSIFQQGHEFNQGFDEITKSPLNANDNSTAIVEEPIEASGHEELNITTEIPINNKLIVVNI
jgi:hypothetical protein